jgi:hypothetical protein
MEHVRKGCLSDLPNVNYYLQVSEPESGKRMFEFYKTLRGTSQTENFHLISADIFNFVTHMSPETYYPLAMGKATRWNIDRGVKVGIYKNYNTYNYPLLESIKQIYTDNKDAFSFEHSILPLLNPVKKCGDEQFVFLKLVDLENGIPAAEPSNHRTLEIVIKENLTTYLTGTILFPENGFNSYCMSSILYQCKKSNSLSVCIENHYYDSSTEVRSKEELDLFVLSIEAFKLMYPRCKKLNFERICDIWNYHLLATLLQLNATSTVKEFIKTYGLKTKTPLKTCYKLVSDRILCGEVFDGAHELIESLRKESRDKAGFVFPKAALLQV